MLVIRLHVSGELKPYYPKVIAAVSTMICALTQLKSRYTQNPVAGLPILCLPVNTAPTLTCPYGKKTHQVTALTLTTTTMANYGAIWLYR